MQHKKVIIVGSGPAGYTAAIYAARANLDPLLFEGFNSGLAGGQLMTTTEVENYPGFPNGIAGPELMEAFRKQAERFGTQLLMEDVLSVELNQRPFVVHGSQNHFLADTLIIATGATAKRLDVPGTRDNEFWQKGVSACAVCDGALPLFRNKPLFVIGGGDTAMEEALFLTKYASRVFIVHRRHEFRASKIMAERALHHPKIEVIWNSALARVDGSTHLETVTIKELTSNKEITYPAGGLFFAIGHQPNTGFLNNQIALHDNGYIKVACNSTKTSVEGVFAAGDVSDFVYRQAISAAGTGCMAALEAERYLAALEHHV